MITVQFGQYGNQIAPVVLERIFTRNNRAQQNQSDFFRTTLAGDKMIPRAVLVDMEPKAIERACLQAQHPYQYVREQSICGQSGSGNNWALGYAENGRQVLSLFKSKLRHEIEKLDCPPTFLAFSSLGGGTGSGLGSFLIQYIKQEYCKSFLLANTVLPFTNGEIAVQDINAVLSLAAVQEAADLVLLCANDEAAECVRKYTGQTRLPSLDELNQILATNLAGQLAGVRPSALFTDIAHSKYNNVIAARTAPAFPGDSMRKFPSVLSHLQKMCQTGSGSDYQMNWAATAQTRIFGGRYCLRGAGSDKIIAGRFEDGERALRQSWADFNGFAAQHSGVIQAFGDSILEGPMASALVNCGCYNQHIGVICDGAVNKCAAGAYTHRYEHFGVTQQDILASVQQLRQLVSDYQ